MKCAEVLETLRSLGTAQNVKTYRRHGAGENLFGVSFANLAQRIGKVDVEHGDTSCKTPDAAEYIRKAAQRQSRRSGC